MERLDTLRALYLLAIDALVAAYPAQEGNRPRLEAWASSARLGFTVVPIETKGRHTAIPAGVPVLYLEDDMNEERRRVLGPDAPDMIAVWVPRRDGLTTRTLVAPEAVIEVVPVVVGYRHPDGLVTLTGSSS